MKMERLRLRIVSGFAIFFLSSTLIVDTQIGMAASDQSSDQFKDAAFILSKAAGIVDLQVAGGTPFLMLAKVVLHEGNKSVEGVFAMTWAAPGQYRRVFRFPNFTTTEVAAGGLIYRQGSTDALPLMIWELDQLLAVAAAYRPIPESKVTRVLSESSAGTKRACVLTQAFLTNSKLCVDAATGEPLSIDRGTYLAGVESMHERSEFSEYQPLEGRMFPRKLTFRGWGTRAIEVEVQRLVRAQSFPEDEFKPQQAATATAYCDSPTSTGDVRPSARGTVLMGFKDVEVDMYFHVSSDGAIQRAQVVYSSDPLNSDEVLHWFIGTHFPIETCGGKPIAYETLVRFITGH